MIVGVVGHKMAQRVKTAQNVAERPGELADGEERRGNSLLLEIGTELGGARTGAARISVRPGPSSYVIESVPRGSRSPRIISWKNISGGLEHEATLDLGRDHARRLSAQGSPSKASAKPRTSARFQGCSRPDVPSSAMVVRERPPEPGEPGRIANRGRSSLDLVPQLRGMVIDRELRHETKPMTPGARSAASSSSSPPMTKRGSKPPASRYADRRTIERRQESEQRRPRHSVLPRQRTFRQVLADGFLDVLRPNEHARRSSTASLGSASTGRPLAASSPAPTTCRHRRRRCTAPRRARPPPSGPTPRDSFVARGSRPAGSGQSTWQPCHRSTHCQRPRSLVVPEAAWSSSSVRKTSLTRL